jgi:hypothetical protein
MTGWPARKALRAASVLGPRWSKELLKEVAGCDDRAIEECRVRGMFREDIGLLALPSSRNAPADALWHRAWAGERRAPSYLLSS